MKRESIAFAAAGIFFGFVLGYVLAFQLHAPRVRGSAPRAAEPLPGQREAVDQEAMMGRITEQVEHLQEHIAQEPGNPVPMMDLGNLLFQAGKFEEAAKYIQMALDAAPDDLQVRTAVGEYWFQLGKVQEARQLFDESTKMNPDHVDSWLNLGVVTFALTHDVEAAERAFAQVDRIQPGHPQLEEIRRQLAQMQDPAAGGIR